MSERTPGRTIWFTQWRIRPRLSSIRLETWGVMILAHAGAARNIRSAALTDLPSGFARRAWFPSAFTAPRSSCRDFGQRVRDIHPIANRRSVSLARYRKPGGARSESLRPISQEGRRVVGCLWDQPGEIGHAFRRDLIFV